MGGTRRCSPAREAMGGGWNLKRSGRRREYRSSQLTPDGDGAQVASRRHGGAANVRRSVASFTASSVGSGRVQVGESGRQPRPPAVAPWTMQGGGGTRRAGTRSRRVG
jgi:hypothetical protein